ncbi:MAG: DUF2470 domain-containing protein [Prochloraceae cyanobacterium]|nr:DUF2470 domain-containing protein [Prochloraceae cyanobacterium]
MSEPISPAISDRICKHMNDDHAEAIVLYARVFGNAPDAETARMMAIDPLGMDLSVQADNTNTQVRIQFDSPLKDAEDAHQTLIKMVKEARQSKLT